MLKLTAVFYDYSKSDDGERYVHTFWLNPKYLVGLIPLDIDPEEDNGVRTRVWIDPSVCIKGAGIPASQDVEETVDQILMHIGD